MTGFADRSRPVPTSRLTFVRTALAALTGLLLVSAAQGWARGGTAADGRPDGPALPGTRPFGLPGGGAEPTGDSLVGMELHPTVDEHGHRMVAVLLRVTRGWHIYWVNPGESGIPTEFEIKAPTGVVVGAVIHPRPTRFDTPDGVTFGHEGTAVFLVPLRRTDGAPVSGTIEVTSRWLVCKSICLSGSATNRVDVSARPGPPVAPAAGSPDALVATAVAQRPRPLSAWPDASVRLDGHTLVLTAPAPPETTIAFFPFDTPGVTPAQPRIDRSGGTLRIEIPLDVEPANALGKPLRAGGLVTLGPASTGRSYEFLLPVPSG